MKASDITNAIQAYCPEAKDCVWEEHGLMGYFKATVNGQRRVITVDLSHYWHMMGVPIPGEDKGYAEVLAEIIKAIKA